MTIIGTGLDATEIDRIEEAIKRYGERFIRRVFTEGEIAYCRRKKDFAPSFAARFAAEAGRVLPHVTEAAMRRLVDYPWPGNVRELQNIMERLVLMTPGEEIGVEDLPAQVTSVERARQLRASGGASLAEARARFERDYLLERLRDNDWNISRTADVVGLARETLSRKLRALAIDVDRERDAS